MKKTTFCAITCVSALLIILALLIPSCTQGTERDDGSLEKLKEGIKTMGTKEPEVYTVVLRHPGEHEALHLQISLNGNKFATLPTLRHAGFTLIHAGNSLIVAGKQGSSYKESILEGLSESMERRHDIENAKVTSFQVDDSFWEIMIISPNEWAMWERLGMVVDAPHTGAVAVGVFKMEGGIVMTVMTHREPGRAPLRSTATTFNLSARVGGEFFVSISPLLLFFYR